MVVFLIYINLLTIIFIKKVHKVLIDLLFITRHYLQQYFALTIIGTNASELLSCTLDLLQTSQLGFPADFSLALYDDISSILSGQGCGGTLRAAG